jgi:hypothetical protein
MKTGDKVLIVDYSLLEKGKTYYFDHVDIWDEESVYVKDENNMICWIPKSHMMSLKQERKNKLDKLNEVNL